jgi:predicted RNA binding protein YcfA (HicA-like mRNA interferase family)
MAVHCTDPGFRGTIKPNQRLGPTAGCGAAADAGGTATGGPLTLGAKRKKQVQRMPPKVGELIRQLEKAGFANRGGKGGHRNFVDPDVLKPVTVPGKPGDDAKQYIVRAVVRAIEDSKNERQ